MCVAVCPQAVFALTNGRAVLADRGACIECGACARNCEPQAIQVRAGVGCAAGVLAGLLAGTEPTCGCGEKAGPCC
jgi:ferredoxin-like protein FixX